MPDSPPSSSRRRPSVRPEDDDAPPPSVLHVKRDDQLLNIRRTQPYDVTLDGLNILVAEDVFPPDLGLTSRHLARELTRFHPTTALDMGCGTGYLAMVLRRAGATQTWALDVHGPAVLCARENMRRNNLDVRVEQSDLFSAVDPGVKFDLIVFNQPYYPCTYDDPVFGLGFDGGREIIERFMQEVPPYLAEGGRLVMPFSDMAGDEHNPMKIVPRFGYSCNEIFNQHDGLYTHMIYEFLKK